MSLAAADSLSGPRTAAPTLPAPPRAAPLVKPAPKALLTPQVTAGQSRGQPAAAASARHSAAISPRSEATSPVARPFAAARAPTLLWFRTDLRLDDNEALLAACEKASSLLPVYVFDDSASSAPRAACLQDALAALRTALRARGSELVVQRGRPESILAALAKRVGAAAVYAHAAAASEGRAAERRVAAALEGAGAALKLSWGAATLHHLHDLPFPLARLPPTFAAFAAAVAQVAPRPPVEAPQRLRGLPPGSPEGGELAPPPAAKEGASPPPARSALAGGEAEALRLLAADAPREGMYGGGSLASPLTPWLPLGCLSPRRLRAGLGAAAGAAGVQARAWVLQELLWRDFYVFLALAAEETPAPQLVCA